MEEPLPVYGDEVELPPPTIRVREVFDLVSEMLLLGIVLGFLAGAPSNHLKLLLVPLAIPGWVLLRKLVGMCRRIFSA